jgi:hypothetical protein
MMTLSNVQYAMVKGLTWMDLYVGSAKEMAKILISVHQKTSDTNINKFTLRNRQSTSCIYAQPIVVSVQN